MQDWFFFFFWICATTVYWSPELLNQSIPFKYLRLPMSDWTSIQNSQTVLFYCGPKKRFWQWATEPWYLGQLSDKIWLLLLSLLLKMEMNGRYLLSVIILITCIIFAFVRSLSNTLPSAQPHLILPPFKQKWGSKLFASMVANYSENKVAWESGLRHKHACSVVCGLGPERTRPHNCRCVWHHSKEQPQLGRTATVESNSSVCFKRLLHSCLKQGSSWQTQGVMVAALNRQLELRVQCAASASCSSTEAASSGTQHLVQKLDCMRGKSQLFHTTAEFQTEVKPDAVKIIQIMNKCIWHQMDCHLMRQSGLSWEKFTQKLWSFWEILSFFSCFGVSWMP